MKTSKQLLNEELILVQSLLDEFHPPTNGEERTAELTASGQLLAITNLPLPDRYHPDYVDILIDVSRYPDPPIGIYLLNDGFNNQQQGLREKFNLFQNTGYHDAESISGYTWICHIYPNNKWKIYPDNLPSGDNLRKYLSLFLNKLEQ